MKVTHSFSNMLQFETLRAYFICWRETKFKLNLYLSTRIKLKTTLFLASELRLGYRHNYVGKLAATDGKITNTRIPFHLYKTSNTTRSLRHVNHTVIEDLSAWCANPPGFNRLIDTIIYSPPQWKC